LSVHCNLTSNRISVWVFLTSLTKEDVILVILLLIIGVAIGYVIFRMLNKRVSYIPYMPIFRNMEMPSAAPAMHNMEAPLFGRKHHGRKIDIETGDLILEELHRQEYWVVKRNMIGDIIDCYRVELIWTSVRFCFHPIPFL
ncbi:MAG TPA: hypothetical protein VKA95_09235, partial [Nitrososphaeraceae archaeon]|nr:hypothetical protein [Nitrososphaeraceae archaeon]